jgi:membrane protein DedA with SNARE-associated domain
VSLISLHALEHLLHEYGYITIFLGIMLESLGLPLPGESLMIAAAVYAATTHQLDIVALVGAAAIGAIFGDQIGYMIGRWVGFPALKHWGGKLGLTEDRFELGRYLFHRYGGRIVFFGRFVAFLRTFAAVLAGANQMPWHSFLIWNALGGIGWTGLYGFGAYLLGDAAKKITGPAGIALGVIGATVLVSALIFIKRNEARLMEEAKREMERAPA